ncbi:uncharacterized protein LOC106158051 [Lingula anatina]|uniref:Uncharacterized protein LOC106158051 n=1 Tax=Lingula anatina TaxID=7574 RepID=A0A1S3HTH9_LINAN|nr:uncharacterized protein LOC106158051 [Lingula anatina]|eukprot:XP_013389342.1 uncharacterized protein LOC106158051 [Lingula anatina]
MKNSLLAILAVVGILAGYNTANAWGSRFYRPSVFGWQDPFDRVSVFDWDWPHASWHQNFEDLFEDHFAPFQIWTPRWRDPWNPHEPPRLERRCTQNKREDPEIDQNAVEEPQWNSPKSKYNQHYEEGRDALANDRKRQARLKKFESEQKRINEEKRQQERLRELNFQKEKAAKLKHQKELQHLREKELRGMQEENAKYMHNQEQHHRQHVLKSRNKNSHRHLQQNQPKPRSLSKKESQLYALYVEGYDPDDITIETQGRSLHISGHHKCSCDENCFERTFEKVFNLPDNVDLTSLSTTLDKDHVLKVKGRTSNHVFELVDSRVRVIGIGIPQSSSTPCSQRQTGFKKQVRINKRTGQTFEPEPYEIETSFDTQHYHDFENDDESTIEVEEYY